MHVNVFYTLYLSFPSTLSSGSSTTRTRASGTSTITNTATITSRAPKAARAPREHSSSGIAAVSDGPFPKQHSLCLFCAPSLTQSYPFLPALCKRLFSLFMPTLKVTTFIWPFIALFEFWWEVSLFCSSTKYLFTYSLIFFFLCVLVDERFDIWI